MFSHVQLPLSEAASAEVEALLASECCPVHPGTTLDFADCPLCRIDAELSSPAPLSPWVRQALRGQLPAKVLAAL